MPFGLAEGIATAAAVGGQAANMAFQGKTNLRTRQFAEEMYFRQRADALADWERTLPKNQMKYLQEAGLNPHLVYGNGAQATDSPRAAPVQSWNPQAPQFDSGAVLSAYNDTRMKSAQQDLMASQKQAVEQDLLIKAQQALGLSLDNTLKAINIPQAKGLSETQLQFAQQNLIKLQQDIAQGKGAYELAQKTGQKTLETMDANLAIAAQTLTNNPKQQELVQEQINNLRKDGTLKKLDIELKEKGIQPTDNILFRVGARILKAIQEKTGITLDMLLNEVLKDKFPNVPRKK